ncbi:hypothetical protein ADUPG1_008674, partial [Aduncisulcus paluster]
MYEHSYLVKFFRLDRKKQAWKKVGKSSAKQKLVISTDDNGYPVLISLYFSTGSIENLPPGVELVYKRIHQRGLAFIFSHNTVAVKFSSVGALSAVISFLDSYTEYGQTIGGFEYSPGFDSQSLSPSGSISSSLVAPGRSDLSQNNPVAPSPLSIKSSIPPTSPQHSTEYRLSQPISSRESSISKPKHFDPGNSNPSKQIQWSDDSTLPNPSSSLPSESKSQIHTS